MNQEVKQKKQKKIMIYGMIISLICVVGISYAFFTAGMSSETSTTVRADAGTMKITYDGENNITLSGIYPRDEVWATKNITVTGNNTTDAEMYYKLTLVVDSSTFKTSDPLQYELVSTNTSTNGEIIPAISKTDITGSSIELGNGHFIKANNARHTYELKIYYPNKSTSQNDNQNAAFSAHVEITSIKVPKTSGTLAELILYNNEVQTPLTTPGSGASAYKLEDITYTLSRSVSSTEQSYYVTYGTGWEANGDKFNLTGAAVTSDTYANSYADLVGKYLPSTSIQYVSGSSTAGTMKNTTNLDDVYYIVSATQNNITYKIISSNKNITEAELASTEDDYGTSYYFRGAVKNNYVEFANKCWRIVRIIGDGSVKLVLHNDNTSGASNPCSSANNSDTAAFAHYSGTTYKSKFNEYSNDNAYVGFMYGYANAKSYESAHANTNKSTILKNLETWYTNNLISFEDKIADTVWCNDKSIVTDTTYAPWGYITNALGYAKNTTYYKTTERLVDKNDRNTRGTGPSLKCSGELSKITTKIGLLSVDELLYAGDDRENSNRASYLRENAFGSDGWTLSPSVFFYYSSSINYASIWVSTGKSGSFSQYDPDKTSGVRASISLISSIEATGSGTSEDPYKVN